MNQYGEKIVPLTLLMLAIAFLAQLPDARGQGTAASDVQVAAHMKAIREDVEAIKAVHAAMAAKLPKAGVEHAPVTFAFALPHLLSWGDRFGNVIRGDLNVTLHHHNGKTVAMPAPHPGNEGMPCYIDASGLQVSPSAMVGTISVRIGDIWSRVVTIGIKASVIGQTVTGSYSLPSRSGIDGPREEQFTGKVTVASPRSIPPPAKTDADGSGGLSDEQYGTAKLMEGVAIALYDDVRAIVLSLAGKVSYAHATALVVSERFGYPPLPRISASGKVEKKGAAPPSLDDVMDDGAVELGVGTPRSAAAAGVSPAVRAAVAKELGRIRERIGARRRVLDAVQANGADDPSPVVGVTDTGDPAFGPWYGEQLLPSDEGRANIVPADAGGAGVQSWLLVRDWTAFGPCEQALRGFETPSMPDFTPGAGMTKPLNVRFKHRRLPEEGETITPQPAHVEPGSGLCRVALSATYEDHGPQRINFQSATTYAWAEVACGADKDLWVGVTVNDHGQFWVNERLVWTSTPDRPVRHMEETGVFRVKFRKGVNHLYLRQDNLNDDGYFAVRVCVRGGPRAPAEVAAAKAAQSRAGSPAEGAWGWRHDFAGHHGDKVTAPVAWDPHEMKNVKWINTMRFCYSSPLVIGDRLITFEEPHTAVCVNKMTGVEIWRRDCDIVETKDAQTQAGARPVREKAEAVRLELARLGAHSQSRIDALVKGGADAASATAKVQEMEKVAGSYAAYLEQKGLIPRMGWYSDVGHTYPSPVTDGKFIYVKVNSGALACLDQDGKMKWIVNHGVATRDCGAACPSPLLIAGKLIVFGPEDESASGKDKAKALVKAQEVKADDDAPPPVVAEILVSGGYALKAFDPASGKMVWRVETQVGGQICGTPAAMRLSNGRESMDIIVTANGTLVRAADGKVLRSFVGVREVYGSPAADGNMFTISENRSKSLFEVTMVDRDTVGVRRRWYVDHVGHFQDGNFGVFHNGKLFFSRPLLDATDVATGNLDWLSDNVFFCRPGRGYAPIASAGGRLYCADNATWFQPTYRPGLRSYPGAMPVVELGDPPLPLACNPIDRISGGFTFDEDRLYVRGFRSLMCIAYTGDEGRAWEAARIAAKLLRSDIYDAPGDAAPAVAKAGPDAGKKRLAAGAGAVGAVGSWLFAAMPAGAEAHLARALSDPAYDGWFEGGKRELDVGGQTVTLKLLNDGNMPHWAAEDPFKISGRKNRDGGDLFWHGPHIGFGEMFGRQVEIGRLVKPESGKVAVLATLLLSDCPRSARFDAGHAQAVKAWIGGAEVKHNQYVEMPAGAVPLIVAILLDDPGEPFLAQPRLWPSSGVEADRKRWASIVGRARPYFENVVKLAPKTLAGKKAGEILAAGR